MSLLDVGVVAFGGVDKIVSFLHSQRVQVRSCNCYRYIRLAYNRTNLLHEINLCTTDRLNISPPNMMITVGYTDLIPIN